MPVAFSRAPHPWGHLVAWRERAGLTQARVAAEIGVSDVTIYRWESGKAPVTVENYFRLSKVYGAATPGMLHFSPTSMADALALEEAHRLMAIMPSALLQSWLDIGRKLAGVDVHR